MVIPVVLTNLRAQFRVPPLVQVRLKRFFRYQLPNYQYTKAFQMGIWDGDVNLMRSGGVAAGLFLYQIPAMKHAGYQFAITDQRKFPQYLEQYPEHVVHSIRDYQSSAVDSMVRSTGGLVLCATGVGKTYLAAALFSRLQGKGLFIVDEQTLLLQSQKEIASVVGSCGIVGGGRQEPERITAATVQTLQRRIHQKLDWLKGIDVVFVDEIHLALNNRTEKVLRALQPKAVFGLTATLELDRPEVYMNAARLTGPVLYRYSIQQGSEEGHLTRGQVLRVMLPLEFPRGNYRQDRSRLLRSTERNRAVAEIVRLAIKRNHRVIVLVQYLEHLQNLQNELNGIPKRVLCGAVPKEERAEAIHAMERGEVPLLLASSVFAKGVNIRSVDVIIDASATKSTNSAIQRYGRGVRTYKDKRGLLFIDIADVGNRFEEAANKRRSALKTLGLPIKRLVWSSAEKVFDAADSN